MADSSFSSSFRYGHTYDVFLSFTGQDTRHGFIGNLYNALCNRGIYTFIDDKQLQRGEQITPALLKAIEESRIVIVVLSENYAFSSFCLDELSKIIECSEKEGQLVLPVFYVVDPSDVRHQTGTYGAALAKHEEKFKANEEKFKDNMERLEKWKMALHRAANLSGWHFKHGKEYEYEFIEKIVKEVSNKISRVPLHVANYPVGMESRVLKVKSLLNVGSDDAVHMVGIYGIGGIGKSTVARAVYNLIADHFDGLCFLDDVREKSIKHGLVHLQETLLSKIVGEKDIKLGSVNEGITIIRQRLHRKKLLLVLDDVDKLEQLQAIVGGPNWFGSGSKVIITTRDTHLLANHGVEETYEIEDLNEKEALELLSWNAFRSDKVDPIYVNTLNRVVTYASGLPLALEVIGSNLFGKNIEEWESALGQYERIPNKEIQKILKVSFDDLEEYEQEVFLDIACCFRGHTLKWVEDMLHACDGHGPKYSIGVLVAKSLIKIEDCSVTLHDLIQDMGREIVRQESPKEPGKRSRLWCPKDIVQVLEDNTGSRKTQIIILDSPKFEEEVDWDGMAFKKMKNLRILIIRSDRFLKGPPKHLPNSLRVLEWRGYPSESLPSDFHPKELVILDMPSSRLTSLSLPKMQKKFVNLSVINFSDSKCLEEIPDVSGVPNLKELRFPGCANLIKIHESVGFLGQLKILDAKGCEKLRTFPPINLTSLERLHLSHCSSLESFPEILGKMENILFLDLAGCPRKELPFSIRNLTRLIGLAFRELGNFHLSSNIFMLPGLGHLHFFGCEGLRLSEGDEAEKQVSSVKYLILWDCIVSDEFLAIVLPWVANVTSVDLSGSQFTILPACIEECRFLRRLYLNDCKLLQEIRGISPNIKILEAANCTSLTSSCRRMLLSEELHEEAGDSAFALPGTSIPEWFEHSNKGPSISFWFRNNFPIISVCLVVEKVGEDIFGLPPAICLKIIINGIEYLLQDNWRIQSKHEADHVYIFDIKQIESVVGRCEVLLEYEWNHVVLTPLWNPKGRLHYPKAEGLTSEGLAMRQSGMHVFKQSSMKDIQFTDLLLLKEDHRFVNMGDSQGQYMQQQQNNLGSLEPQVGQGREPLSLLPPPEMKSLNNNVNRDSNSMVSTQINRTTSVQGCETASRKRKRNASTLDLDSEACETSCQAPSKVALDSNSIISSSASEGGCEPASTKRKINPTTLDLDSEAGETFCQAPSKVALDSDAIISSFASEGGLQEQKHSIPIIKQSIKGCESVNEANEKGMEASNSNDGEDNDRSPLLEMLPIIKEYHVTSDKNQHASNEENLPLDPMQLEYQVAYPKQPESQ